MSYFINSELIRKNFTDQERSVLRKKTASIEELIVFLLTLNQLPMTRPDTS